MSQSNSEWDQRILCSDGNCIGIIGADGRCKACGLPYDGQRPLAVADTEATEDTVDSLPDDNPANAQDDPLGDDPATGTDAPDGDWENRTLCIDESCIGVIGPDGRCKECGKPYPG
jgi:hypothetical protein